MNAEDFLAEADAPPSAADFLTDAPNADDFLDDQPGAIAGTVNEFKRGLLAGQQQLLAAQLAAAPKAPTMRQLRKGYVTAMSDPRYGLALNAASDDPQKLKRVEDTLGPTAQVDKVTTAIRANRQFLAEDIATLESEAQAIPASEAMTEWAKADNSNWYQVLAKHPFQITAGIMAQSLPAMAPAMAANVVAPGGRVGRALATGAGSFGTEAANAFLDSARQTGYDFTDPAKVQEFFANPEAQATARAFAATRGVPIAIFDALTAGIAGRFIGPALKQGAKKILLGTAKEIGVQMTGGAAGEAAAQVVSGQPLSIKDIVAEALGELGSGPQEVLSNLREGRASRAATAPPGPSNPGRPMEDELPPAPAPDLSAVRAVIARDEQGQPVYAGKLSASPSQSDAARAAEAEAGPAGTKIVPAATAPTAAAPEQSAAVPPPPVPEDPRTITAQMEMLRNGKRSAVLITTGEAVPVLPANFKTVELPGYGTMIYNPRVHREERIIELAKQDKLGRVLGYGVDRKPAAADAVGVVTVRNPEGVEKQAVVTSQEDLPKVVAAAEKVADKEDTVQLEPAEQVIADRKTGLTESTGLPAEEPNYDLAILPGNGNDSTYAYVSVLGQPETTHTVSAQTPAELIRKLCEKYKLSPTPKATVFKDFKTANEEWATAKKSNPVNSVNPVKVSDRHLQEARAALEVDRPPSVHDDISGQVTSGPVRFPEADYRDMLDTVRDELAQTQFKKPYKKLRKEQRAKVDKAHRMSVTEGVPADEVLRGIASANEKYAAWSVDDLAEALSRPEAPPEDTKEVKQLAREIADAEAGVNNADADAAIESWADETADPIEAALDRAINATNLDRTRTLEGITGAPVWLTKSALNGLLRIVRATYRGTRNLAQAIQAGIEWLRAQNLPNYSETELKAWLERNITTRPADDDLNLREFQDQLDNPEAGEPDIGRQVGNLLYQRRTNESDAAFAARIMQAVGGPAQAIEVFTDATNGMPGSVRMLLGQLIIKALGVAGQHQAAARFYDETFAAHVTNIAQALQSLNAWLALTPEGKVIWARRKIERAAEDLIAPVRPVLDETKKHLDETNRAGIEETTAAPDVQAAAREAVDAGIEKQAATPGTELADAIRKQVLDTLVAAGLLTDREAEIFRLHLEGTADNSTLAEKLQRAGIPLHDKRAKAINDLYKAKTETERQKIRATAQKARKQQSADPNDAIDKAIRKAMKELRVMLGQIIREHHTKAEAVGQSLAEKIAAASGLTEADAKKLAEAVQKRFAEIITKRKRAALEKLLKPITATGLGKRTLVDKLVALSNLGALTEEQFWNAVRTNLNLPTWSNDLADHIRKQVDIIERIPEDQTERKQKAQIELLNTIERAKGVDAYDLAISFYVTNILTGLTTHLKNIGSTFLNASGAIGGEVLRSVAFGRLDDIPLMLEAIGQGVKRGKLAAGDVLRTGVVTGSRLTKIESGRTLELTKFGQRGGVPAQGLTKAMLENRLASILNLWKYNFRLMAAEDLMFFKPAEEVKAALLAKRIARSEGLNGPSASDRARQLLGYGRQAIASAQAQATREGFTGATAARRTAEILNAVRPIELREDAQQYALRTTFNGEPYGALGFVAHLINQAKAADNRKIRLGANLIAPFTNIIANVVNESLNYTPIGVLRARWQGKELLGYAKAKLTPAQQADLRAELYSKALIGTVLLSAVALKAAGDLDDKDPDFAIYGAGPANQTDRQGLEAKGFIAHSIKLGDRYYSYANTPLAIPLAWLGNIADRIRDARIFGNRSAQRTADSLPLMAASAAKGMVNVISEQSFLTGIMQLMQTISEPSPEIGGRALVRQAVRIAGSFVVPNAVQQLDRAFDPTVYQQRDATAMLVNSTPFLRGAEGLPAINALGLPVTRPLTQAFTSSQADAPALVKFLAESGNWPSLPDRNHIYPRTGRTMTDAEYYNYVKGAGALAYARLDGMLQNGTLAQYKTDATRAKVIAEYIESSRKQWRSQNGW